MVKKAVINFKGVKSGGGSFTKRRVPEGDYRATVTKVEDAEAKGDSEDMWLFTVELKDKARATYPYYCKLVKNQYWKIRNLFEAAGLVVPDKKVSVDPSKVVGKTIGVTLVDTEYDGKLQSEIASVFPPSEIGGPGRADDDDDEEEEEEEDTDSGSDEEEEEEEEETSTDDSDDEEDEEEDDEDEEEKKRKAKRARAKARKEKQAAEKKKAKKKKDEDEEEDDDELEELEIEDL